MDQCQRDEWLPGLNDSPVIDPYKGGVTPQGVQWFSTKRLDTAYCKLILMSCDQFWIAAECPARLVLVRGISNAVNAQTIKCASLQPDITQLGKYGWVWWRWKLPSTQQVSWGIYQGRKSKSAKKNVETTSRLRLKFSEHNWVWLHVVTIGSTSSV